MKRILLLALLIMPIFGQIMIPNAYQQPEFKRTIGLGYGMRWFFHDISGFRPIVTGEEEAPHLGTNIRLQGITLYGMLEPNIVMGMSAWGNMHSKENDAGRAEWFGLMAGVFVEGRKNRIIMDWYGTAGLGVHWGYFGLSGTSETTDYTPNLRTSTMLIEPTVGLGYDFSGILELRVTGSYITTKFGDTRRSTALEYNGPDPMGKGWTLSTTIRYNIPTMIE